MHISAWRVINLQACLKAWTEACANGCARLWGPTLAINETGGAIKKGAPTLVIGRNRRHPPTPAHPPTKQNTNEIESSNKQQYLAGALNNAPAHCCERAQLIYWWSARDFSPQITKPPQRTNTQCQICARGDVARGADSSAAAAELIASRCDAAKKLIAPFLNLWATSSLWMRARGNYAHCGGGMCERRFCIVPCDDSLSLATVSPCFLTHTRITLNVQMNCRWLIT